ncbi:KaiC domain-containing protein [Halorussus limi]|uniref:KaiC domain-containing protein n=1 Tax=Halorussus limi TaxID=2938695 RepID=A0A8U0HWI6_9EURY|nr:KaiC domain-containing protein [Halorussus limi]UPV74954.1 KaiC domain-containing protein [Halorussus limi]
MTEDDDWFERALREEETEEDADERGVRDGETDDSADGDSVTDDAENASTGGFADAPDFDADADDATETDADAADADAAGSLAEPSEDLSSVSESSDSHSSAGESSEPESSASESAAGGFADADPYDGGDDEDLFEEDFASAFESAPGAGGGPDGDDFGSGFGGEAAGSDDGGFGGGGGEFGMGGDDFDGGFGGGEPFEDEAFDDEEFESDIPRIDLGIEGLDNMIQGGVPERSLVTTIGSAGTGKTTFGLQFLHEALERGENAVFITLEESHDRIVNTATEKGWDFDEYEREGSLAVIDLDPIEMANSLTSIRNDLPRLIEDFGATRLVLDSVSLLEMMYDEQATRRNEIYDFTKSLKEAGVTTMLTSEASEDTAYASRHGIIEYLVDAVFVLRYIRSSDDFRETRLAVEIQKIRDANHSREIKPYSITNEGISVYRQANIF